MQAVQLHSEWENARGDATRAKVNVVGSGGVRALLVLADAWICGMRGQSSRTVYSSRPTAARPALSRSPLTCHLSDSPVTCLLRSSRVHSPLSALRCTAHLHICRSDYHASGAAAAATGAVPGMRRSDWLQALHGSRQATLSVAPLLPVYPAVPRRCFALRHPRSARPPPSGVAPSSSSSSFASPSIEARGEFLYGLHPVMAALQAGKRRVHRVFVQEEGDGSGSARRSFALLPSVDRAEAAFSAAAVADGGTVH